MARQGTRRRPRAAATPIAPRATGPGRPRLLSRRRGLPGSACRETGTRRSRTRRPGGSRWSRAGSRGAGSATARFPGWGPRPRRVRTGPRAARAASRPGRRQDGPRARLGGRAAFVTTVVGGDFRAACDSCSQSAVDRPRNHPRSRPGAAENSHRRSGRGVPPRPARGDPRRRRRPGPRPVRPADGLGQVGGVLRRDRAAARGGRRPDADHQPAARADAQPDRRRRAARAAGAHDQQHQPRRVGRRPRPARGRDDRPAADQPRAPQQPALPRGDAAAVRRVGRPARDRRGALHLRLGPRLPPRLPAGQGHARRARAGGRGARHDRDRQRPGRRRRRRRSSPPATASRCARIAGRWRARACGSRCSSCRGRPSGSRGSPRTFLA